MTENLDRMLAKVPDEPLAEVVSYLERLGVAVAALVASVALMKYASLVLPGFPCVPAVFGFFFFLASFALLAWVTVRGWSRFYNVFGPGVCVHVIALFLVLCSHFFVLAGLYAAYKS